MSSRIFSMDEDEMNSLISGLDKAMSNMDTASSSMSSSFKKTNESGLFGSSINKMQKNISSVASLGTGIKNKISQQKTETFETESMLTSKINDIDTPQDFVKTNPTKYNSIDDIQLSKRDGESIKSDNSPEKANDIAESSIAKDEQLYDLTKEATKVVNEIADNSIKSEETLYNITGEQAHEFNQIADNSIKEEKTVSDITGQKAREFNEIADNSIKDSEKLSDIKKEETKEAEKLDVDANDKKKLENIIGQESSQVEYKPESNGISSSNMSGGFSSSQSNNNISNQGSSESFNYTSSNVVKEEDKKEEKKDTAIQDMLNNLSIYDSFARNQEQAKHNTDNSNVNNINN